MDEKAEVEDLRGLLRSQVPIVLVETHEEPRIVKLIAQACNLEQKMLFKWSIVDGLCRHGRDESIYNTNEIVDVLKHIDKTAQSGVFVLCDAHPGLSSPVNVRLIRETALAYHECARTLVFISPQFGELPSELVRLSAHFRPRLPNRKQIRAIVEQEAQLWQSQQGEKPRADRAVLEQVVLHLLGLEQEDVRRLIRQALRGDGKLDGGDLKRVIAHKHAALGSAALGFEEPGVRFDAVGGLARLKRWIELRRRPFFEAAAADGERKGAMVDAPKVDAPKGIVLLGVQGGGKSLAARAIAGEWNVPLMRLDVGALYNKYYGETERNLRQAFAAAEGMAPCVLWIDEIEKAFASDSSGSDGAVSRRVLGAVLTWLAERRAAVFIVATANDISQLPPELIRKGRFDEIFFVDFPEPDARREILRIHLKKRGLDPASFDLDALAAAAPDFSGAEIEQAIVAANFECRAADRTLCTDDLARALRETRPLSVIMAERIDALRNWASDRAVMAGDRE
jgi:ATPase family associated with various cellular activities (AAA)